MKTIQIEPKYVGFPVELPSAENQSPVENPAEFLDYSFSDCWYRFREASGKIHDSGIFIDIPSDAYVVDEASFKNFLLSNLSIVEITQ